MPVAKAEQILGNTVILSSQSAGRSEVEKVLSDFAFRNMDDDLVRGN
jgi:hypothetical protein